ncbi:MAG: hypothetical protein AVDCRST_MAG19-3751, partial [uncultured Thermomicrobiales bacterium]
CAIRVVAPSAPRTIPWHRSGRRWASRATASSRPRPAAVSATVGGRSRSTRNPETNERTVRSTASASRVPIAAPAREPDPLRWDPRGVGVGAPGH